MTTFIATFLTVSIAFTLAIRAEKRRDESPTIESGEPALLILAIGAHIIAGLAVLMLLALLLEWIAG